MGRWFASRHLARRTNGSAKSDGNNGEGLSNQIKSTEGSVRPMRLVAFDSSQLGDLARDAFSTDARRRHHVQRFQHALIGASTIPLLCYHHLEELMQHEDDRVVRRRLDYLRSLPALAWIVPTDGRPGMGTIVDILAAEARAALQQSTSDAQGVVAAAKCSLIQITSGERAMEPIQEIWPMLAALARMRTAKSREIVAITSGNIPRPPNIRVSQLTAGSLRDPLEAQRLTAAMERNLADDIAHRADRRIRNPGGVAEAFFERVRGEARALYAPSSNPILEDLRRRGVRPEDLEGDPTIGELIDLMEFRSKLDVLSEACGLDCAVISERGAMRRLPAWMIENGLRRHGQRRPRNAGGDLTDRQLACLSPYADLTFVDKRTAEDVRRVCDADPLLMPLLQGVRKVVPYSKVAGALKEISER